MKAPRNTRLSYVKISNIGNGIAEFIPMPIGANTRIMKVMAVGNPGDGILVRVEAAAINIITSPEPTEPEDTVTERRTTISSSEE